MWYKWLAKSHFQPALGMDSYKGRSRSPPGGERKLPLAGSLLGKPCQAAFRDALLWHWWDDSRKSMWKYHEMWRKVAPDTRGGTTWPPSRCQVITVEMISLPLLTQIHPNSLSTLLLGDVSKTQILLCHSFENFLGTSGRSFFFRVLEDSSVSLRSLPSSTGTLWSALLSTWASFLHALCEGCSLSLFQCGKHLLLPLQDPPWKHLTCSCWY